MNDFNANNTYWTSSTFDGKNVCTRLYPRTFEIWYNADNKHINCLVFHDTEVVCVCVCVCVDVSVAVVVVSVPFFAMVISCWMIRNASDVNCCTIIGKHRSNMDGNSRYLSVKFRNSCNASAAAAAAGEKDDDDDSLSFFPEEDGADWVCC